MLSTISTRAANLHRDDTVGKARSQTPIFLFNQVKNSHGNGVKIDKMGK
jgi:hypothetical protein